jgi:FKBP-type peptidyl-prolyl cis-trans isomerase SlyD
MSNDSEADADEEPAATTETEPDPEGDRDDTGAEPGDAGETETGAADADGTDTEAADEEHDDAEETLQDGDFIELAYTARTVEDGDLVDTTDEEVAEEADVDADQEFAPRTVVLGEGHIFPTVESDIVGKQVGDSGGVVVEAEEAFGEYDDEEVRTISKDKIPEDDRYPGAQVTVDGQQGFVETIIGGRARVDFNHPLAGEAIEYEYEVVGEVTDRQAKAEGLLEMLLDLDLNVHFETDTVEEEQLVEPDEDDADEAGGEDDADEEAEPEFETVEVEKESLYIEATPQLTMNQQWMFQKQQIAQQLIDLLGVDRVVIQEIIDGSGGMGMPGMMGGMGGMGGADEEELEAALEEADVDADELADELGE